MTLDVGVIGAGNIFTRGYAPVLASAEAVHVTAICDIDPEHLAAAGALVPNARRVTSAEALLALDDLEAVFILTPTHTHAALAIAALEAGKHVLCEKPMARSTADAARMAAAEQASGRRLMIAHARRFDERWTTIAEQLRAGRIGDLVYAYRSEHAWAGAAAGGWQWQDAESGGVLWDVGVHVAELFHWYFDAVPATAFTKLLHARPESAQGGAPDAAIVTFAFDDDRHAVLSVSWLHPPSWGPFYASMDLVGTSGRIEAHDRDSHPVVIADAGLSVARHSPLLSATGATFRREIEHFARAIESGTPFAVSLADAEVAVRMIDAAERSARSGLPEAIRP